MRRGEPSSSWVAVDFGKNRLAIGALPNIGPAMPPAKPSSVRSGRPTAILHCIPTLEGGGAERQLRALAPALLRRGFEVAIFSRFQPRTYALLCGQGLTLFPIKSRGHHSLGLTVEFFRAIRSFRPDVIQTWLTQMDILAGCLPPMGQKWVLSERASAPAYSHSIKSAVRRLLARRADCIVANSPMGAQYWSGLPAIVIPNGVDPAAVASAPQPRMEEFPFLANRKIILAAGRLTTQKQMQVLIEAMDAVRRDIPDAYLVILGEGPEQAALERVIGERDLAGHVHLAGFRSDALGWMKVAEIFCSSSLFEGQPNVVLEAAASRLPMVLSDIPEHRHTMGDAACYAAPHDPAQFAAAIISLMRSRPDRISLCDKALQRVDRASFDQMAQAYAALYRKLVKTCG